MAATKSPPRRGVPYYDVASGRKKILPREGGKAVDYIEPSPDFDARRALRRAGLRAREEGAATARTATGAAGSVSRLLERADASPNLGVSRYGVGGLLVFMGASIIGLALLENLLGGRGPAAYERILGAFGGGIKKLVDPTDTIVPAGKVPPTAPGTPPAGARGPVGTVGTVKIAPNANRAGVPLKPGILAFARELAAAAGRALTIGTGTNHSRLTTSGNESDHWPGNAVDIPASGNELIRLGRLALELAGMPRAQAQKQTGGLYNVGGMQIIFNTLLGGDHTDHLHIGDERGGS